MKLLPLAWRSLLNRRFSVILTVITIAISIALLVAVDRLRNEVRQGFYRSVSGTALIVGARTSPVQLLLYSVFGIGDATNNVSWESYREITASSMVDWAVPIALGDAHRGYRVAGTTEALFEHFRHVWILHEAVAGNDAMKTLAQLLPLHPLRRAAVRKGFWHHIALRPLLQAVVTNLGRGVECGSDIGAINQATLRRVITPDAGKAVGLQLHPHRELVAPRRVLGLETPHL